MWFLSLKYGTQTSWTCTGQQHTLPFVLDITVYKGILWHVPFPMKCGDAHSQGKHCISERLRVS